MSEPTVWRKENAVSTPATPSMAMYSEAMNKFTKAATAFMDHVHLLTEARDAYEEAMAASTALRKSLDAGDQTLRSLRAQLAQVVYDHLDEPALDRKKPELVKAESTKAKNEGTGTARMFP